MGTTPTRSWQSGVTGAVIGLVASVLVGCGSGTPETTLSGADVSAPGLPGDALSGAVRGSEDAATQPPGDTDDAASPAPDSGPAADSYETSDSTPGGDTDAPPDGSAADVPESDLPGDGGPTGDGLGDEGTPDGTDAQVTGDAEDAGPVEDVGPGPECVGDEDCSADQLGISANACLYPACHAGHCVAGPTPAGQACSSSVSGAQAGCVTSFCDGVGGCKAVILEDTGCDDGNPCTTGDLCSAAGVCVGGKAVICQPTSPCELAVCDKEAGGCVPFAASNGLACDDGDPCTIETACSEGVCAAAGNICACIDDSECADDGDLCNGVPHCVPLPAGGKGCVVDPSTVITCGGATDFCHEVTCHKATGQCVTDPLPGAPCNDAKACTKGDVCHADGSCSGNPTECDDGVPCTVDSCEPVSGLCLYVPSPGAPCNDGDACTEADHCQGTVCDGTPKVCDDGNPCTSEACDPTRGACKTEPLDGGPCSDGTACTTGDACSGGACVGLALGCDDDNPCTDDGCSAADGCVYSFNASDCKDGDACTGPDTCDGGACVGGVLDCDDGVPCTADSCDSIQGCKHVPASEACDDGEVCTTDLCDPAAGCVAVANDAASCSDGNACTTGDACSGGACVGQLISCSDGVPCTLDACASGGACVHQPTDSLCEDGNPCTAGVCDAVAGCSQSNLGDTPCEDGDACTEGDLCAGGQCHPGDNLCPCTTDEDCDDGNPCNGVFVCAATPAGLTSCEETGGPILCEAADAGPCVASVCQPSTGACALVPMDDGTTCPDDDPCTIGEHCNGGVCLSSATACNDDVECTLDSCQSGQGCVFTPQASACSDGVDCTTDSCSPVAGCVSVPVADACADAHDCTSAVCDPAVGCKVTTNDPSCDDGVDCTTDVCDPSTGCASVADDGLCDDGDDCTLDTCDHATGCHHAVLGDGVACDDGNACTFGEKCVAGSCGAGSALLCSASDGCQVGQCDPQTGACSFTDVADGTPCDDGDACSEQTKCAGGTCSGGETATCNDGIPCTVDGCDPASGCTYAADDGACDDNNPCTTNTCVVGAGCKAVGRPDFATCDDGTPATTPDLCVDQVCRGTFLRSFDITSLPWCESQGTVARKVSDLDGNGFVVVNYDQGGALCGSGRSRVLRLNGASAPSAVTGGDTGATLTSIGYDVVVGDAGQVARIEDGFVNFLFNDVAGALDDIGQGGGSWADVWGSPVGSDTGWFFVGKTGSGQSRAAQCFDDGGDVECEVLALGVSNGVKNNGSPVAVSGEVAGNEVVGSAVALTHVASDWLLEAEYPDGYSAHQTLGDGVTRDVYRFGTHESWICGVGGLLRRFDGSQWHALTLPGDVSAVDLRALTEVDGAVVVVGHDAGGAWLFGLGATGDPANPEDWTAVDLGAGREAWDVQRAGGGVYVVGRTTGSPADAFVWYLPLQ